MNNSEGTKKELKILKTTINVGLEKPVKFLHVTDTHITIEDPERPSGRLRFMENDFEGCIMEYYFQAVEYARKNNLPIVNTGDVIDYITRGNLEFLDKHFADVDYIYAVGNHDFADWVGPETVEIYEYKWKQINKIAPHIKNNLYFASRLIGGVNIVTLDDSYYQISQGQMELLKAEVAKGYPILLCMHVPLYTKDAADYYAELRGGCWSFCGSTKGAYKGIPFEQASGGDAF